VLATAPDSLPLRSWTVERASEKPLVAQLVYDVPDQPSPLVIELRPIHQLAPDTLAPLLAASAEEGFRFVARLAEEWNSGVARYDRPGEVLLGGYVGARLVAVGGLTSDPYGGDARIGRLRHVYVLPDVRRGGIGRRLVRALEAAAVGGYHTLVLRTDTDYAARFYEALGYTRLAPGGTATHGLRLEPLA
jgi:ribosomal protein S18 acetylase RimI-like enzyme